MHLEPGRCVGAEWDHAAGHSLTAAPTTARRRAGYCSSANLGEQPLCKLLSCNETRSNLIVVCIAVKMYMPVIPFYPPKLLNELGKPCT